MKKLLFILFAAFIGCIFAACDKDDSNNGKKDPYAKIYIRGVDRTNKNLHWNVDGTLTAHQVCLLDSLQSPANWYFITPEEGAAAIDTINDRLIMWAENINDYHGNELLDVDLMPHYLIKREWYSGEGKWLGRDTVAYVPQAQRREAYAKIAALWESEDWDSIYEIFQNAFTFIPCTGEEFRALVEAGIE